MEPTTQKLVHTFGALADLGQEITDSSDFSRMVLTSLHPDCCVEQVRENIGWEVRVAADLKTTGEPMAEELRIIREELDPAHLYI